MHRLGWNRRFPSKHARTSRPKMQAIGSGHAGRSVGRNVAAFPAGNTPSGTLNDVSQCNNPEMALHSVGFVRECLNNQIFILVPPSFHERSRGSTDHRLDVFKNILLLPASVMKGY